MSRFMSFIFGVGCTTFLYGCTSHPVQPTSVVIDDVFTCSGGIVQKSEITTKYSNLQSEGKNSSEVALALDNYIKGAGITDENFIQYNNCIISLNKWRQKHKSVLFAALSKVENNTKSRLVSSKALNSDSGEGFSDHEIDKLAEWLNDFVPSRPESTMKINIPKEIKKESNVAVFFEGVDFLKPSYYLRFDTQLGFKGDILLNGLGRDGSIDTTSLSYPFYLNVVIPGYETTSVKIEKEKEINEEKVLKKMPVKIAIEKFSGQEHSVAERLGTILSLRNSDFTVFAPEYLQRFGDNIEPSEDRRSGFADMRKLIALDYVVSGSVTSQLDK